MIEAVLFQGRFMRMVKIGIILKIKKIIVRGDVDGYQRWYSNN